MTTLLIAEHDNASIKDSTNKALTAAAKTGALENVRINLGSIQDAEFKASVEARLRQSAP